METTEFCEQCGVCHEANAHLSGTLSPYPANSPSTQDIRDMVTKIVQETLGKA